MATRFKKTDVVIAGYGISGTDEHGSAVTVATGEKVMGGHFLVKLHPRSSYRMEYRSIHGRVRSRKPVD